MRKVVLTALSGVLGAGKRRRASPTVKRARWVSTVGPFGREAQQALALSGYGKCFLTHSSDEQMEPLLGTAF